MTHNSCPPPAYGINTQGGMNPCFLETMETIMTCHYSGVLFKLPPSTPPPGRAIGFLDAPSARARGCADHFEVYPTLNTDGHGNGTVAMTIGMKHNNSPTARSIGDHAEVMPTMETDCGCHFSVCQPTPPTATRKETEPHAVPEPA